MAWIDDGWIYTIGRQTQLAWIQDGYIYPVGGGGTPKVWIHDGYLYWTAAADKSGYTGFFIQDEWLYGPSDDLPWQD